MCLPSSVSGDTVDPEGRSMSEASLYVGLHPAGPPVPVVVLGDFGRDAALRFCRDLADRERERLTASLPGDAPFLDEYRRSTLRLVGDLPFAKEERLRDYWRAGRRLDDRVLVGFPGGPTPEEVAPRLGVLLLEALAGPAARGATRAVVALPCNTLAPVSWALERAFGDEDSLARMIAAAGAGTDAAFRAVAGMALRFPTVPAAALAEVRRTGGSVALPLGTMDIVDVYRRAARRMGDAPEVSGLDGVGQRAVLTAIQACIGGDGDSMDRAADDLGAVVERAEAALSAPVTPVAACTDLTLGIGIDSNGAYADAVLAEVYGDDG